MGVGGSSCWLGREEGASLVLLLAYLVPAFASFALVVASLSLAASLTSVEDFFSLPLP